MAGKPEWKTPFGRTYHKREEIIKMNRREIFCEAVKWTDFKIKIKIKKPATLVHT